MQGKVFHTSSQSSNITAAGLKYVSNFSNPYVKLIVACKVCNKEQSMTRSNNWKQHYFTHQDEKPHKCSFCPKSFIRADKLRQHIAKLHPSSSFGNIKSEEMANTVKYENF